MGSVDLLISVNNIYFNLYSFQINRESVQFEKVHPLDPQEDMVDKAEALNNLSQNQVQAIKESRTNYSKETITTSSIRCLKDILMESQSDSPNSPDLSESSDTEECFSKVIG